MPPSPSSTPRAPGVSALVDQKEINDLPINGRRVDQFVLLTPGVTTDGAGGEVTFRGVPGNNIFLQDGMDVTQQWGQDDAGGVGAFSPLSQDAVQEFQVETSGYTAEFGHAAGGIVNTLTKSGYQQLPRLGLRVLQKPHAEQR